MLLVSSALCRFILVPLPDEPATACRGSFVAGSEVVCMLNFACPPRKVESRMSGTAPLDGKVHA